MNVIELSHKIDNQMPVFPGDTDVILKQTHFVNTDGYSNFRLECSVHIGTHIDSTAHFLEGNPRISEINVENFCNKAIAIDVSGKSEIGSDCIIDDIEDNLFLVLFTGHYKKWGQKEYYSDYPVINEDFIQYLIRKKVKMLLLDTPSPDKSPYLLHPILFKAGILIAENLTNTEKLLGLPEFNIFALPLNINSCGSPARIIAQY